MAGEKATTEQLRDDIDRGRTGEKVNVSDPAAAPLGTDEEAAGTPIDAKLVAEVRERERAKAPRRPDCEANPSGERWRGGASFGPALAIVSALAVVGALIWALSV